MLFLHLYQEIYKYQTIFDQCSTYIETRWLVFTNKIFEKHLWKSHIASKDAGRWPVS